MIYQLKHCNDTIATINIDRKTGEIQKIEQWIYPELLPIGISSTNLSEQTEKLKRWWNERTIPIDRENFSNAMKTFEITKPTQLAMLSNGVSLTDNFWIKPNGSSLTWEQVNFYDNSISNDVGNILLESNILSNKNIFQNVDFHSPDNTTDGFLQKRWEKIDGEYYLIKSGTGEWKQEPFNEVVISKILDELNIPHVQYNLIWKNNKPYSICKNFTNKDTEYITAFQIYQIYKKRNNESNYQHFQNCCQKLGFKDYQIMLNQMLSIDYIFSNIDRHYGNFGILINSNNNQIIGSVPIFDNGNSFFYQTLTESINSDSNVPIKPFPSSRIPQIQLVTDFSWLEFSKLSKMSNIMKDIGDDYIAHGYMSKLRINSITKVTERKIKNLEKIALNKDKKITKTKNKDNFCL